MVSGSTAMNYYTQPRMTRDIDIVVQLSASTGTELAAALLQDFYVDLDTVAEAVLRQSMFDAIPSRLIVKVDSIVRKDTRRIGRWRSARRHPLHRELDSRPVRGRAVGLRARSPREDQLGVPPTPHRSAAPRRLENPAPRSSPRPNTHRHAGRLNTRPLGFSASPPPRPTSLRFHHPSPTSEPCELARN